ncbi:MAG TPA: aspartate--tRNA(Asn) ligase [Acidilobales archaeon]|nr:aspartate--tRNA(Asn) ligase [Acidilobales archaeon]
MPLRTHFSSEITPNLDGKEVVIAGWVHFKRDLGGKKFLILRDMYGFVQVIISKDMTPQFFDIFDSLTLESVVSVRGVVKKDPRAPRGAEIVPMEIKVLNKAKTPLPLDVSGKVPADFDTRLRERVLDLRRNESKAMFRIIHVALKAIRETLEREGFIEVFTPKIIAAATEGGANLFPVIYFGKEAFLAQSPQLYKELLAGAFERVFEIAPAWRAEESDTPYHLAEFISVDIEAAFMNYEDVMKILEEVVYNVIKRVKDECSNELKLLKHELPEITLPLRRVRYAEAIEILRSKGVDISIGEDLGTPELRVLAKEIKEPFYFIIDWPTATKPFYIKPKDDNPEFSESFDLNFKHLELASGGTRIHKKELLIKRLKEQGLNPASFGFFLKWFDYGMPPHAGWGMGLARLAIPLTGKQNVKELVLFPRDKKRLVP